ncbi:MAG: hypothetical protein JRH01_10085 [Deltaproteobacteria bacterium]|nr:hypothetical protein [Deltaproteobacteria bacterium]MBW2392903.1 hypothetical protein [Deltaproteobacteria bacterium]
MPRQRRTFRSLLCSVVVALALVAAGAPALAHDHDSTRSGHPLRIIAYVLHPVGVILDTLILKPAHWLGSFEPIATLVGHEED